MHRINDDYLENNGLTLDLAIDFEKLSFAQHKVFTDLVSYSIELMDDNPLQLSNWLESNPICLALLNRYREYLAEQESKV